jgi:hypothetical protein
MCAGCYDPAYASSPAAPRRGLFPPQLVSGLAAAPLPVAEAEVSVAAVLGRYAQLLQLSLARPRRSCFDWAGVQLYAELQALAASLARAQALVPHPLLEEWSSRLSSIVPLYQERAAELEQTQSWLEAVRQVLDDAALPTKDERGPGADRVARQLAVVLGAMMDEREVSGWQVEVQRHMRAVSERYWRGILVCYDVVGVPRTNNALEGRFGRVRRQARRQSGFRQLRRVLMRQGAWMIYQAEEADVTTLQARLAAVPQELYQQERARFAQRQARFQVRHRWYRQQEAVLAELEADWLHVCASFTQ